MTYKDQLPEEVDVEYTPVLTALPDGWNALTYQEYTQRKAAQYADKENIRAVQMVAMQNKIAEQQALLDEAKKRAEQAEAELKKTRRKLENVLHGMERAYSFLLAGDIRGDLTSRDVRKIAIWLRRFGQRSDFVEQACAQRDAANNRAEQAEADIDNLRASLAEANRFVAESGRIIAELQENIAKEREAKLHQTELQLQAIKERDEAMQEARNHKNRWIEASRQQEIAEADARALAEYASISIIVEDVEYGAKKMERITQLTSKYGE